MIASVLNTLNAMYTKKLSQPAAAQPIIIDAA